jgi:hypothetical protein
MVKAQAPNKKSLSFQEFITVDSIASTPQNKAEPPIGIDSDPDLLARWPHLARPGPQPHNQIGTLREMLALSRTPRPTPEQEAQASFVERVENIVRRVLVEELPPAVEYIIDSRHGGQNGKA